MHANEMTKSIHITVRRQQTGNHKVHTALTDGMHCWQEYIREVDMPQLQHHLSSRHSALPCQTISHIYALDPCNPSYMMIVPQVGHGGRIACGEEYADIIRWQAEAP